MARVRHLTKAPILEAMIDIRVQLPDSFTAETLDRDDSVLKETL